MFDGFYRAETGSIFRWEDEKMLYWIILVLLILGSAALLGGTFISLKKNKVRTDMAREDRSGRRRRNNDYADNDYDEEERAEEYARRRREARRREQEQQSYGQSQQRRQQPAQPGAERKRRRQWKIILQDMNTLQVYSFIFYDNVGIGRVKGNGRFEKYLSVEDGRVSKQHCVIVHKGDMLYLRDLDSRNGTYLNGTRVDQPIVIQKSDVIGVGETELEVQRILRESEG